MDKAFKNIIRKGDKTELLKRWKTVKEDITPEQAVECEIRALDELNGINIGELHIYLKSIGVKTDGNN